MEQGHGAGTWSRAGAEFIPPTKGPRFWDETVPEVPDISLELLDSGHFSPSSSQFSPPWRSLLLEVTHCHQQQLGELVAESLNPGLEWVPPPQTLSLDLKGFCCLMENQEKLHPSVHPALPSNLGLIPAPPQAAGPLFLPSQEDPGRWNSMNIPSLTQGSPVLTERGLGALLVLLRGAEGSIPCRDRTKPSQGDTRDPPAAR